MWFDLINPRTKEVVKRVNAGAGQNREARMKRLIYLILIATGIIVNCSIAVSQAEEKAQDFSGLSGMGGFSDTLSAESCIFMSPGEDLMREHGILRRILLIYEKELKDMENNKRPHAVREDTALFPALRGLISDKEHNELGDKFEDKEHELFGESGFEDKTREISEIEKWLGIYALSQFTPR